MKLPRVYNPKPCLQYTWSLDCDVIDFICNFKLFKAISRNYFDIADGLVTISRSIKVACVVKIKLFFFGLILL